MLKVNLELKPFQMTNSGFGPREKKGIFKNIANQ